MKPAKRVLPLALCIAAGCAAALFLPSFIDKKPPTPVAVEEITVNQLPTLAEPMVLVDARADQFFNGWPGTTGAPQGHIEGAVNFQPHWLELAGSSQDQQALLAAKGINKEKTIVVYDDSDGTADELYQRLKHEGYAKVYRLAGGIKAWGEAGNDTYILPRYDKLVFPQWVQQQLASSHKPVILEVGYDEESDYRSGHIPDAIYLDTREIEWDLGGTPSWNYVADSKLATLLAQYGIAEDTTVVVYADKLAMGAYRAAVGLMYMGVDDVRVLNGGKQAWENQGYALQQGSNKPTPLTESTLQVPENKTFVINIPEVKALLEAPDTVLAAVMTPEEFSGEKSGYLRYRKAGHVPGSVLLENGDGAYDMLNYEDLDGTMRSWTEIAKMWQDKGLSAEKEVSFYCGTGWRASETFFAAYLMGWDNISVFDDGWIGWSMDRANPVASNS